MTQYKDVLPLHEIQLRENGRKIVLTQQWDFLYWYDGVFVLNQTNTIPSLNWSPPGNIWYIFRIAHIQRKYTAAQESSAPNKHGGNKASSACKNIGDKNRTGSVNQIATVPGER